MAYAWQCKGCKGPPVPGSYWEKPWTGPCPHCGRTRDALRISTEDEDESDPVEEGVTISLASAVKKSSADKTLLSVETGSPGLDWLFGGGLPPRIAILLAAPPGAGKTTFLIETLRKLAQRKHRVLFLSTEESTAQLGKRFSRLAGDIPPGLRVNTIRDLDNIEETVREERPTFFALDSLHKIKGVVEDGFTYSTGSSAAILIAADRIRSLCTELRMTSFMVSHVSKTGDIAGSNTLQHDQDAVLYLNGEQRDIDGRPVVVGIERTLRCDGKNRFIEAGRCARFQMRGDGLHDLGPWKDPLPPWNKPQPEQRP